MLRRATSIPTRINSDRFLTVGSAESTLSVELTTSTTTHAQPPGTGPLLARRSTLTLRMVRQMPPVTSTTVASLQTTCWRLTTPVLPPLVLSLVRSRPALLPTSRLPRLVVLALFRLGGRSVTRYKVDHTMSTITPARRPGLILVGRPSSGSWVPTARTRRCSPRRSRSSGRSRLVGRCVLRRRRGCTLWTTTRRRRRGTIRACRRRWTRTCRSTSATSGGSSSTSARSRRCATSRATARSRSGGTTSSRTRTQRSCVRHRTTSRRG